MVIPEWKRNILPGGLAIAGGLKKRTEAAD